MMKLYTRTKEGGFTIVELLIVIVVIAILAAISIVAYTGIQQKAHVSAVSSGLTQANRKLATHIVENTGYPADLASIGITNTNGVTYQYSYNNTANPATYCITATSGSTSYKASSTSQTPSPGGCAGHGIGGVAAITNLVANPSFETNLGLWSGGGDNGAPTATRVTTGQSGSYHLTLSKAAPVGSAQFNYVADVLKPNTTYTAGFWAWADTPGTASVIVARNNISFIPFIQFNLNLTTTPTYYTMSGTTPADSSQMRLRVTPLTDGSLTHYDGFIIYEGATPSGYADGSTTDWVWNGTPHASTSTGPAK